MERNEIVESLVVLILAFALIAFSNTQAEIPTGLAGASSAGDIEPPIVRINSPGYNRIWTQIETVSVTATDNIVVRWVDLWIDGKFYSTDPTTPYNFIIKTHQLSNGQHSIQAKTIDREGNTAETLIEFITVNNIQE
ncbi:MAG: Ig-like domain-containing protein [archaeon]|nr:Ig-like domain-containing protein [archaeon]